MKKKYMICLTVAIVACIFCTGCNNVNITIRPTAQAAVEPAPQELKEKKRDELIDSLGIHFADELPTQLSVVYLNLDMTEVIDNETPDCIMSIDKDADKKIANSLQIDYTVMNHNNEVLTYDVLFFDRYTGKALSTGVTTADATITVGNESADETKSALIDFNGHDVSVSAKCKYTQEATEQNTHISDIYTIECDDPEYDGLCALLYPINVDLFNKSIAGELTDVKDVIGVIPVQAALDLSKDY